MFIFRPSRRSPDRTHGVFSGLPPLSSQASYFVAPWPNQEFEKLVQSPKLSFWMSQLELLGPQGKVPVPRLRRRNNDDDSTNNNNQ